MQEAPRVNDLKVSLKDKTSYYLRVSKTDVMFVEVLPFLTQSQINAGFTSSWLSQPHLQELMYLLRSHLTKNFQRDPGTKEKELPMGKKLPKNFILCSDNLRAACNYRSRTQTDYHLIPRSKGKDADSPGGSFQEVAMHSDKLLVYLCPRSSSSMLHISQLLTSDKDAFQGENEDISKYFQPVS